MTDEQLTEAELQQRKEAARTHGVYSYDQSGRIPARLDQGFDQQLAAELLDHVGGDEAYRLLAQSAARRGTLLEIAYSWLARDDVPVMWAEEQNGTKVVKLQPILRQLGSWHEGLRRDLAELGLTPQARAKLGLPQDDGLIDAALADTEAIRERMEREDGGDDD